MKHSGARRACVLLIAVALLVGCNREQSVPPTTDAGPDPTAAAPSATPVKLEDVLEITPDHVVGISYPDPEVPHPVLAAELKRYAEAARAELLEAVQVRDSNGDGEKMLYDLSLNFSQIADTPQVVAYAAEGSSFTGGAHGTPLLARFVWLPQQDKRLTNTDLVPRANGWRSIAGYVREELHTALSQRVDADELGPGERAEVIESAGRMIDEGTTPDPGNFAQFEPMVNTAGKLTGLRFVFVPYQVGTYADGVQTVEVPASVLLPHVAPEFRDLFVRD